MRDLVSRALWSAVVLIAAAIVAVAALCLAVGVYRTPSPAVTW